MIFALEDLESALDAASDALRGGRLVVVPTDTVYGLAVCFGDAAALAEVFELKQRPLDRHVPVLVADRAQAERLVVLDQRASALVDHYWPGPLTIVASQAARPVDPTATLGVRCPDSLFLRELARNVGPLSATSANRHGQPTVTTAAAAADLFPSVEVVVDAGILQNRASTVVEVIGPSMRVLRTGSISESALAATLAAAGS